MNEVHRQRSWHNCALKDVKSNNFICSDYWSLIVNFNKVASPPDLLVIETCIKNLNFINAKDIQSAWLPQSKSYLKILSILYLIKGMNIPIDTSVIEIIIKTTHVFNNIWIAPKLRVVKVLSKSDIAIIWIDIWNMQSGSSAKILIKRFFNVRSYIATICEVKMNLDMPQYKNCWKWEHTTFMCRIQESKCVKCNRPHK